MVDSFSMAGTLAGLKATTMENSFSALEQSSLLSRSMVHITENHNWTEYRDQRILGRPAAMETSSPDLPHPVCVTSVERGWND